MSDTNTMNAGPEPAVLRAKNLIVAIFNKGEGKTYELAYKMLWFTIPLDLILLYCLSGFSRSPLFLLNIIAFKLLFAMMFGWVFSKFNRSGNDQSSVQGIDWTVGIIWAWFCSVTLMLTVFGLFSDGRSDPLMKSLSFCTNDIFKYITTFVTDLPFPINERIFFGGIAFFVYASIGVFLCKMTAKLMTMNSVKKYKFLSGFWYWFACCISVAVMNGVVHNFYKSLP